jgi:hypothetical protein
MIELPFAGDTLGSFTVESIDASHRSGGPGLYLYSVHMVLRGMGGQQGVRRALKPFLAGRRTTFSGYGNPYQLWCGKPEIQSLGDRRYAVRIEGAGARISLAQELERFLEALQEDMGLAAQVDRGERAAAIEAYLEQYRLEIKRKTDRYRRKLRRMEKPAP